MIAVRHGDYFVEPTPATVPEHEAHKDAPPLPPLPESVLTQVAHHPSPRFPWRFFVAVAVALPLLWMLVNVVGLR